MKHVKIVTYEDENEAEIFCRVKCLLWRADYGRCC